MLITLLEKAAKTGEMSIMLITLLEKVAETGDMLIMLITLLEKVERFLVWRKGVSLYDLPNFAEKMAGTS